MTTDELRAVTRFCFDYHPGGGSRLYRLGCRAQAAFLRRGGCMVGREAPAHPSGCSGHLTMLFEDRLGRKGTALYRRLEARYASDKR